MEWRKMLSIRLFLWIGVWFVLLGGTLFAYSLYEFEITNQSLRLRGGEKGALSASETEEMVQSNHRVYWQVLAGSLGVSGMLLWLTLRRSMRQLIEARIDAQKQVTNTDTSDKDQEMSATERKKQAIQLLTILQREGRLLDFLKEDLGPFDDQQIGVAVRSIHENCKKALESCLDLKAVLDQEEGSEVIVSEDFDPGAIKLKGNVSGNPPYKGVLQHRGWRVVRFDLPTLSSPMDPDIIAPAEVEI